jgi:hypothetical protein
MDVWIHNLCTDELNVKTISEDCYHVRNLFVCIHKDEWEKNIFLLPTAVLKWNGRHEAGKKTFLSLLTRQWISEYWKIFSLIYGATSVYFLPQTLDNVLFVCVCYKITWNCYQLRQLLSLLLYLFLISSFILIFFFNIHFNWNEIKFISLFFAPSFSISDVQFPNRNKSNVGCFYLLNFNMYPQYY